MGFKSAGLGDYQANKPFSYYMRRKERPTKRRQGILYVPGLTGDALSWEADSIIEATWKACAEYRYRLFTINEEIQWGNSAMMTKLDNAYAWCRANLGFRTRVHLFGTSGGGPAILNWARANPTLVASIVGIVPAIDIQDIDDNNLTAVLGLPAATYGPHVAYGGARPPDANNPADNTSGFSGIPMLIHYGISDPICRPGPATTFINATGCESVALPGGHSSVGVSPTTILNFFTRYARRP
jgi:alpha-beta hydrolase superfamily lysophospholipase